MDPKGKNRPFLCSCVRNCWCIFSVSLLLDASEEGNLSEPFEQLELVSGSSLHSDPGPQASPATISPSPFFFNTSYLFISLPILLPTAFLPLFAAGLLLSPLGRYPAGVPESASRSEHQSSFGIIRGGSAVIFFITEPALTQRMECTGRISRGQQSGPLPTLGYANPSTAVSLYKSNTPEHFKFSSLTIPQFPFPFQIVLKQWYWYVWCYFGFLVVQELAKYM